MNRREEHAFIKIGKDIKAGDIPCLVVLCGEEEFLVDFYEKELIGKYVNKASEALDLVILDRDKVTVQEIVENLETMPLMSERKIVLIPDFIDSKAKLPKSFQDSHSVEYFVEYIEDFIAKADKSSGLLLLMTFARQEDYRSEQALKKSKLFKAIKAAGNVYDFQALDPRQLTGFIEKRLRTSGKQFKPGIASLIASESGYGNKSIDYGLFNLDNDLKKLIAHCGQNEEITQADVASVITVNPENNVFAMIDAIGRNRKDEAFGLLHNLLEDGSSEFQLLSLITKQLELMLTTCEMKDQGMSLKTIQASLKKSDKVHEYRTQKALEAGSRFMTDDLKRILSSAYEVEPTVKTGLMPAQLALEYFIAGI